MRLVLFDIDGTLILTGGAGMRAFHRAVFEVFNLPADQAGIRFDGKTDPLVAREFLAHFGQEDRWQPQSRAALFTAYLAALEEEMARAQAMGFIRILPGVESLLAALASRTEFALGLVTGNLEQGARIKLGRAGIDRYFRFGGYGSDAEDRTALIRIGIGRGAQCVAPAPVEAAFVIGDTPLDITHGRAAGAQVIAVASGRYNPADLEAYHPDLLVPNLCDSGSIISFISS